MKNEIPPKAGLEALFHRMMFSSKFLIPRFLENLRKIRLIRMLKIKLPKNTNENFMMNN